MAEVTELGAASITLCSLESTQKPVNAPPRIIRW